MYSKSILLFALLACSALVHGIAIGKDTTSVELKSAISPQNGITVQRGNERYVVSPQKSVSTGKSDLFKFARTLTAPIVRFLIAYKAKITYIAVHALVALALGTVVAIAVCSFSSVCSFSIADKLFKGQTVKEKIDELKNTFVNNEYLEFAKKTLTEAIELYGSEQPREVEQPNQHLDEQNITE